MNVRTSVTDRRISPRTTGTEFVVLPVRNRGSRSLGKIPGEAHADTAGHFITAFNWGSEQTVSGTMQLSDNL